MCHYVSKSIILSHVLSYIILSHLITLCARRHQQPLYSQIVFFIEM